MGLLRFSISSWFSFGKLYFSKNLSFLPSCPFYWHRCADSSLLWSFVFLCCLLWFLHFHFYFCWSESSPFVSWWVWLMVCQFYLSSQNWFLALLIFAMVSFVSFAFISALTFKISFLLLTLGFFISSFSSCFRCRVRLFIWLFVCLFLEVCLYCYELSS